MLFFLHINALKVDKNHTTLLNHFIPLNINPVVLRGIFDAFCGNETSGFIDASLRYEQNSENLLRPNNLTYYSGEPLRSHLMVLCSPNIIDNIIAIEQNFGSTVKP
jgi:hypothetical protein